MSCDPVRHIRWGLWLHEFLDLRQWRRICSNSCIECITRTVPHSGSMFANRGKDLKVNFAIGNLQKLLLKCGQHWTASNSITSTYNSAFICIQLMFRNFQRQANLNLNFGSRIKAAHDIIKSNTTQHRRHSRNCVTRWKTLIDSFWPSRRQQLKRFIQFRGCLTHAAKISVNGIHLIFLHI